MQIIPVIHIVSHQQVYKNIETVLRCGLKKVFIIKHGYNPEDVLDMAPEIKKEYPELWLGVNVLGFSASFLLEKELPGIDGLWSDDDLTHLDMDFLRILKANRKYKGMFFGGLAFKYQRQPSDLAEACEKAKFITDVATTSGDGTGMAPTLKKIKNIDEYLKPIAKAWHPLAIASGVNENNIEMFSPFCQYALVATSITDNHELIEQEKLLRLIEKSK